MEAFQKFSYVFQNGIETFYVDYTVCTAYRAEMVAQVGLLKSDYFCAINQDPIL